VVLFEIVDDADVGEAEGSAAFEDEGDARALVCVGVATLKGRTRVCRAAMGGVDSEPGVVWLRAMPVMRNARQRSRV
jgi:hypothetical protein